MDVAQAVAAELRLQNTIHWVKSIAIEKALAGTRAGLQDDLAVGHYKPINSQRFLHDCHEFVFHFTPDGAHAARSPGGRREVPGSVERRTLADRGGGSALPRQHLVHPVRTIQNRDKDRPHPATFPPQAPGNVPAAARPRSAAARGRSVHGTGSTAVACAQLEVNFVGIEMDEGYLEEAVERTRAALESSRSREPRTDQREQRALVTA